jgi:hypothetical protein
MGAALRQGVSHSHPLLRALVLKAWMAGINPAMTGGGLIARSIYSHCEKPLGDEAIQPFEKRFWIASSLHSSQ